MITYAFIGLILVVSILAFMDKRILGRFIFHPYSIKHNKEHDRFLTHAFIHGDFVHLLFNVLALYSFGLQLEENFFANEYFFTPKLGRVLYIALFTGGIYAASGAIYLQNRNNPSYTSLGASGAISAIVFSYILVKPLSSIIFLFINMRAWLFGVLMIGLSFWLIDLKKKGKFNDNISHEAHLWGALFGIVFTILVKPQVAVAFIDEIFR
jgi:membrane associated rhomboid family serine protease